MKYDDSHLPRILAVQEPFGLIALSSTSGVSTGLNNDHTLEETNIIIVSTSAAVTAISRTSLLAFAIALPNSNRVFKQYDPLLALLQPALIVSFLSLQQRR